MAPTCIDEQGYPPLPCVVELVMPAFLDIFGTIRLKYFLNDGAS